MELLRAICGNYGPEKGAKAQEYFVYYEFEQRINGIKDPKSAKDAFIQRFHNAALRLL